MGFFKSFRGKKEESKKEEKEEKDGEPPAPPSSPSWMSSDARRWSLEVNRDESPRRLPTTATSSGVAAAGPLPPTLGRWLTDLNTPTEDPSPSVPKTKISTRARHEALKRVEGRGEASTAPVGSPSLNRTWSTEVNAPTEGSTPPRARRKDYPSLRSTSGTSAQETGPPRTKTPISKKRTSAGAGYRATSDPTPQVGSQRSKGVPPPVSTPLGPITAPRHRRERTSLPPRRRQEEDFEGSSTVRHAGVTAPGSLGAGSPKESASSTYVRQSRVRTRKEDEFDPPPRPKSPEMEPPPPPLNPNNIPGAPNDALKELFESVYGTNADPEERAPSLRREWEGEQSEPRLRKSHKHRLRKSLREAIPDPDEDPNRPPSPQPGRSNTISEQSQKRLTTGERLFPSGESTPPREPIGTATQFTLLNPAPSSGTLGPSRSRFFPPSMPNPYGDDEDDEPPPLPPHQEEDDTVMTEAPPIPSRWDSKPPHLPLKPKDEHPPVPPTHPKENDPPPKQSTPPREGTSNGAGRTSAEDITAIIAALMALDESAAQGDEESAIDAEIIRAMLAESLRGSQRAAPTQSAGGTSAVGTRKGPVFKVPVLPTTTSPPAIPASSALPVVPALPIAPPKPISSPTLALPTKPTVPTRPIPRGKIGIPPVTPPKSFAPPPNPKPASLSANPTPKFKVPVINPEQTPTPGIPSKSTVVHVIEPNPREEPWSFAQQHMTSHLPSYPGSTKLKPAGTRAQSTGSASTSHDNGKSKTEYSPTAPRSPTPSPKAASGKANHDIFTIDPAFPPMITRLKSATSLTSIQKCREVLTLLKSAEETTGNLDSFTKLKNVAKYREQAQAYFQGFFDAWGFWSEYERGILARMVPILRQKAMEVTGFKVGKDGVLRGANGEEFRGRCVVGGNEFQGGAGRWMVKDTPYYSYRPVGKWGLDEG
jgi:hypothetical protein